MNEDKGARYQRLRRRALMFSAAWSVLLLSALLVSGASRTLRDLSGAVAAWLPWPAAFEPAAAAIFVSILFFVHEAGALPLAAYGSHVLDRRYDLSRQPTRAWLCQRTRALALGWVIAVGAACVTYALLRAWPHGWWIWAWAAATVTTTVGVWAAPVWIFPLFFRFSPLCDESLKGRLAVLAERAGVPALGVFEWRVSDRTTRANAALAGLGATRRILVTDTLVADYSEDEIEVILAHELSHHVSHDVWRTLAVETAVAGLSLWVASLALPMVTAWMSLQGPSDLAGLPGLVLILMLVSAAGLPLANGVARAQELRADRFALGLTRKPEAFSSAIRRLSARHLADEDPSWFARTFFDTHPPVRQRLALARKWTGRSRS